MVIFIPYYVIQTNIFKKFMHWIDNLNVLVILLFTQKLCEQTLGPSVYWDSVNINNSLFCFVISVNKPLVD